VTYRAKVDWWIGASIGIGLAMPVLIAVLKPAPWMFGVALATWSLVFGFCFPQSYETTSDAIVIRAGLSRRTIPYSALTAVRPAFDTRSSLALSVDRVQIESASGELLISPQDQTAFLADVASHAPQLSRQGQDLVVALG
jgi:hypothetical protein